MNAKHTPGPWKVCGNTIKSVRIVDGVEVPDEFVAMPMCGGNWDRRYLGEWDANAKLIATSPDLLAFARECARADSDCGPAVREAARALVAKATA